MSGDTLQGHIQGKRRELESMKTLIDGKRQMIRGLELEMKNCLHRHHIRKKYDLEEQVNQLKKEIEQLQDDTLLTDFEEQVKPFLQEQERCKHMFCMEDRLGKKNMVAAEVNPKKRSISSVTLPGKQVTLSAFMKKKKGVSDEVPSSQLVPVTNESHQLAKNKILDDYLMIMQDKAPPIVNQTDDVCEFCGHVMLLDMEQSILACSNTACGAGKRYMDATANAVAYGEDVEFAAYSYQRTNYFNEYLTMFQAKESNQVNAKDMESIMQQLYDDRITDVKSITLEKIREVVKKKRLNHLYKQLTQIWCRITGHPPPRLPAKAEEKCRHMFRAIQEPYDKYLPPERKNFFSYSYVLFKFMQLLGYPSYLKHFTLLKDRPKLDAMDTIWKCICNDLDWEYLPSPSTSG
jgi:hypothetical protein